MTEELFKDNKEAQDKVKKAKAILQEAYYSGSSLCKIVSVRNATPDEKDFLQLGYRRLIPKEWFTESEFCTDLVFRQFARNLAMSEEGILIRLIFESPEIIKTEISENIVEDFISHFKTFSYSQRADTLLIPIDLFVTMHIDWPNVNSSIKLDYARGRFTILDTKPNIFWSNKYTPFDDIAFLNRDFALWTSKPNFENRLEVKISQSGKEDQLDLMFLTRFKLRISNPTKALILHRIKPTKQNEIVNNETT